MASSIIIIFSILLNHTIYSQVQSYSNSHAGGKHASLALSNGRTMFHVKWTTPNEPGWVGYRNNKSRTTLIRNGNSPYENQEIEAYIVNHNLSFYHPNNYSHQQIIRNIREYYDSIKEYNLVHLEVNDYSENRNCLKIYILLEYMQDTRNNEQKRWSEQHALSCHFPIHRYMGFELRYYQRYYDNNRDHHFSNKAERLFRSLKIKDKQEDEYVQAMHFLLMTLGIIPVQFYTVRPPLY